MSWLGRVDPGLSVYADVILVGLQRGTEIYWKGFEREKADVYVRIVLGARAA